MDPLNLIVTFVHLEPISAATKIALLAILYAQNVMVPVRVSVRSALQEITLKVLLVMKHVQSFGGGIQITKSVEGVLFNVKVVMVCHIWNVIHVTKAIG